MTTTIEIEGDLVRAVNKTIVAEMTLSDFLPHLETHVPVTLPLLPKTSTRAVTYDASTPSDTKMGILAEQPPRIINLDMNGTVHRLSIPFSRWYFRLRGTHGSSNWSMEDYRLLWAKRPYADPNAKDMIPALLPNIYRESGSICFGSTSANIAQVLADRLDQTMNEFYATQFNQDLTIEYPETLGDYAQWAEMTEKTPLNWSKWTDWENRRTFSFVDLEGADFDRTQTLMPVDPIPEIPIGASFGRVEEWLNSLNNNHRNRIMRAIEAQRRTSPHLYEAEVR